MGTHTHARYTDAEVNALIAIHNVTTGVHGVGAGTIGSVSTANKTIYVDKAATGAADGTSWTDAFTTIQAAVDSVEDIIIHDYTIQVREGATPYRETIYLNSDPANYPAHLILGSLTIEGEFYLQGDCEANVGGAGEITDTGAFGDVAVGDKVYVLYINPVGPKAEDYEVCTVDDIANAPNRIGTDGAKTPTTNWIYVIVRTEISGSDDGTDGGTARDNCFNLVSIDNVNIYGFFMTFSDTYAVSLGNSRNCEVKYAILEDCDQGVFVPAKTEVTVWYIAFPTSSMGNGLVVSTTAILDARYVAIEAASYCVTCYRLSRSDIRYAIFGSSTYGLYCVDLSNSEMDYTTIKNTVTTGLYARGNSYIKTSALTNNATTPIDPVGTTEGAYIV